MTDFASHPHAIEMAELLPAELPAGWKDNGFERLTLTIGHVCRWYETRSGLRTCVTIDDYSRHGHGRWLHSSTSRRNKLPSWDDMKLIHEVVHGGRPVVQILPPKEFWVNVHKYTLHLFERIDGTDTVPVSIWDLTKQSL